MNKEFIKVLATILGTVRIDKDGKVVEKYELTYIETKELGRVTLPINKAYQEATEVIRLIPLSEFVKLLPNMKTEYVTGSHIFRERYDLIKQYTDFITQQLTKGQLDLVHTIMYVDFNINCVYSSSFSMLHLLEILEVKTIEQAINNGIEFNLKLK